MNTGWHCCCSRTLQFAAVLHFYSLCPEGGRNYAALNYNVLLLDLHIQIGIFHVFMSLFQNLVLIRARLINNTEERLLQSVQQNTSHLVPLLGLREQYTCQHLHYKTHEVFLFVGVWYCCFMLVSMPVCGFGQIYSIRNKNYSVRLCFFFFL